MLREQKYNASWYKGYFYVFGDTWHVLVHVFERAQDVRKIEQYLKANT